MPDYQLVNLSAGVDFDNGLSLIAYVNNLFDEYYETGVVSTSLFNQVVSDDGGDPVYTRSYFTYVGAPRVIGARFNYKFGG